MRYFCPKKRCKICAVCSKFVTLWHFLTGLQIWRLSDQRQHDTYCITSYPARLPPYTWELEPQRSGWLMGLRVTSEINTGISTISDKENVTHTGESLARTMNADETWCSLEEDGTGAERQLLLRHKGSARQGCDCLDCQTSPGTECTYEEVRYQTEKAANQFRLDGTEDSFVKKSLFFTVESVILLQRLCLIRWSVHSGKLTVYIVAFHSKYNWDISMRDLKSKLE